jgi:hypothetical protein
MATNLSLYRGVAYPSVYQHTDGNGNNLPLTGCKVHFTIKNTKYDDDMSDSMAVFKTTVTSHTDAAAGLTEWETLIPATDVAPGKYYYDIVVQEADSDQLPPVLIGEVKILGKRTNRTS